MKKNFNTISTSEIDAKLYYDTLRHENQVETIFVIVYIVLCLIFWNWFSFWLKFGIAFPSAIGKTPIVTAEEPIQENYKNSEVLRKSFIYYSLVDKRKVLLMPKAHFKMSALTVATNKNIVFIDNFVDSVATYELAGTWGKLGNKKNFDKYFFAYSAKEHNLGYRGFAIRVKPEFLDDNPINPELVPKNFAQTQIIPANRNVLAALLKIKKWDKVVIEGELVDIEYGGNTYSTSLTRGSGSCENIYATSVQIGKYIYK